MRLGRMILRHDVYLSYLPLAHIFERAVLGFLLFKGGAIGFYQGDVRRLLEDVAALRPHLFVGAPRVFDRIYDRIWGLIREAGGAKRALFEIAFASKRRLLRARRSGSLLAHLWDRLVFAKIRARLGGRVRVMVSGSAPLSPSVHEFLQICFSVPVLQGTPVILTSLAGISTLTPFVFLVLLRSSHVCVQAMASQRRLLVALFSCPMILVWLPLVQSSPVPRSSWCR